MSTFSNPLTEYSPQMEASEFPAIQLDQHAGKVFSEIGELELATRFLEVTNEQELEYFLGDLVKQAGIAFGKSVDLPLRQSLAAVLKTAAREALPIAATSLGNDVAGSLGAKLGAGLAAIAGNALGLELEGLSPEDGELEATRQFVKFAGQTVKNAVEAPRIEDSVALAKGAAVEAARVYAPGLVNISEPGIQSSEFTRRAGRWIRHHRTITLIGL